MIGPSSISKENRKAGECPALQTLRETLAIKRTREAYGVRRIPALSIRNHRKHLPYLS